MGRDGGGGAEEKAKGEEERRVSLDNKVEVQWALGEPGKTER